MTETHCDRCNDTGCDPENFNPVAGPEPCPDCTPDETEPIRVTELPGKFRRGELSMMKGEAATCADLLEAALKADPVVRVAELVIPSRVEIHRQLTVAVTICAFRACPFMHCEAGYDLERDHKTSCPVGAATARQCRAG